MIPDDGTVATNHPKASFMMKTMMVPILMTGKKEMMMMMKNEEVNKKLSRLLCREMSQNDDHLKSAKFENSVLEGC